MSALSNLALTRIRERCHAVAANDTSDNCDPDPHPGEQHQAPESAADVACMADELIALRGSTAALREAAEAVCAARVGVLAINPSPPMRNMLETINALRSLLSGEPPDPNPPKEREHG